MKKTGLTFVSILFTINSLLAQSGTEKEKVNRAMLDYLEGFYEGDTAKIIRSILPEVVKYGFYKSRQSGQYGGEPMSFQEMIAYAKQVANTRKTKPLQEGIVKKVEIFDLQDQTAAGKVTAWWGTDYILLEKKNDKWMIRMVLWQGPLPGS